MKTKRNIRRPELRVAAFCVLLLIQLGCDGSPESEETSANEFSEGPCASVWRQTFDECYQSCTNDATWGCVVLLSSTCSQQATNAKARCCGAQQQTSFEQCME